MQKPIITLNKGINITRMELWIYCTYRNTRPYSELLPFDEESIVVQHIRKKQNYYILLIIILMLEIKIIYIATQRQMIIKNCLPNYEK